MEILLHPVYFGPISQYVQLVKADKVTFENEDNYQKQTYRNRMYIYDSNGKLLLNIPIKHSSSLGLGTKGSKHQKYKDVLIANDFEWQKQHWRALKASYQTSPFFEFYEDELYPLYHKEFKYLMDFNYACLEFVLESIQLEIEIQKTSEYILHPKDIYDFRSLVDAKSKTNFSNTRYPQVFEPKYGFIPNLSIIDLLFNEGPNSLEYLKAEE
jgi:hypothetical protein